METMPGLMPSPALALSIQRQISNRLELPMTTLRAVDGHPCHARQYFGKFKKLFSMWQSAP